MSIEQMRDDCWHEVGLAARKAGVGEKDGLLRGLHVQLYDRAKTEKECLSIKALALAEVETIAAKPKEPTMEEEVAAMRAENAIMRKEINELKARR